MKRGSVAFAIVLVTSIAGCKIATEGLGTESELFDVGPRDDARVADAFVVEDSAGSGIDDAFALDDAAAPPSDTIELFPLDETGIEAPPPPECTGKPDGTLCGDMLVRRICLGSACVPTRCGDKFVDLGESCDDGNTLDGDLCPGDCKYECTIAADPACDDKNPCTTDSCDLVKHVCSPPVVVAKGTACTLPTGGPGYCNGSACTSPACGNKTTEPGEECDDGNTVDGDGCDNDCTFSCKTNADCDDKNACTGIETCDVGTHKCKPGTVKTCMDTSACTFDLCDPATGACNNPMIDFDGDGNASNTLGACGTDCNDGNPEVHPGQTNWYDTPYPWFGSTKFDYDCSGKAEVRWPTVGKCEKAPGGTCKLTAGWAGGSVPACGEARGVVWGCVPGKCDPLVTSFTVKQQCH